MVVIKENICKTCYARFNGRKGRYFCTSRCRLDYINKLANNKRAFIKELSNSLETRMIFIKNNKDVIKIISEDLSTIYFKNGIIKNGNIELIEHTESSSKIDLSKKLIKLKYKLPAQFDKFIEYELNIKNQKTSIKDVPKEIHKPSETVVDLLFDEDNKEHVLHEEKILIEDMPSAVDINFEPKTLKDFYYLNRNIERFIEEKEDSEYTLNEKEFISKYTGYGGLDKQFSPTDKIDKGILYEYYTPEPIIEKMWGLAYKYGYKGGPVLEPASGTGAFLQYAPRNAQITAYETNPTSAKILSILYPNTTVINKKFETAFLNGNNSVKGNVTPKFDLVIGNPPYGMFGGFEAAFEKPYTHAKNYIEYFITRGLDLLNTNGLLIFVIGGEVSAGATLFLDQQFSKTKKIIRDKSKLVDAYRLPNGIFDRTDVLTDIIVLRKK